MESVGHQGVLNLNQPCVTMGHTEGPGCVAGQRKAFVVPLTRREASEMTYHGRQKRLGETERWGPQTASL